MIASKTKTSLYAAFASASLLMTAPSLVHAGDACKNVKFMLVNEHNGGNKIELRKVKYFNQANGKWQTEDVKNMECSQGRTCTTNGDNLRDAEGENLTKLRFVYRYYANDFGWSDEIEGGDKTPSVPNCYANRTYGAFTIYGKS